VLRSTPSWTISSTCARIDSFVTTGRRRKSSIVSIRAAAP
jgi:hypothetical protein